MNFGDALQALKNGDRVERRGWNGRGMWLKLVRDWGGIGVTLPVLPFIAMRTADGSMVPWLASQTDILADDWAIAGGAINSAAGGEKATGDLKQGCDTAAVNRPPVAMQSLRLPVATIIIEPALVVDLGGQNWWVDPVGRLAQPLP